MTQHNKQARQTFHCFVLNSHFIQPSECKFVFFLFVCLSDCKYLLFRCISDTLSRVFFRTVDLSRENRVMPPTLRFSRKRIEIIFRGRCRPRKLKSAKNNPHIFETKPRKFGDAKISHYMVFLNGSRRNFYWKVTDMHAWLIQLQHPTIWLAWISIDRLWALHKNRYCPWPKRVPDPSKVATRCRSDACGSYCWDFLIHSCILIHSCLGYWK